MKHPLAIYAASLVLAISSPSLAMDEAAPLDVGLSALAMGHLDASMAALVETGRRSGVVWAVAKNGKLVSHKTAGLRDVENDLPMETDLSLIHI